MNPPNYLFYTIDLRYRWTITYIIFSRLIGWGERQPHVQIIPYSSFPKLTNLDFEDYSKKINAAL